MCHITGGGLLGNLPRVVPEGLGIAIDPASWTRDPLFQLIQERGGIADREMWRTFNMGVGFVIIVDPNRSADLLHALGAAGEHAFIAGRVTDHPGVALSSRIP